jgi:hypothetical protein
MLLFRTLNRFSESSKQIKEILQKIKVDVRGAEKSLLDSGMISYQHLDPENKKFTIHLHLSKDYMKIKNIIK